MTKTNDSAVVIFAAHGRMSGRGELVSPELLGEYNVLLPVKSGDNLCLTGHNFIVSTLVRASSIADADDSTPLLRELEHIKDLPSTTSVSNHHTQAIDHGKHNIGSVSGRKDLSSEIETAKTRATDGKDAWELLEHTLCHAAELLDSPKAFLPSKMLHLHYTRKELDAPENSKWYDKITIHVNHTKLIQQVKTLQKHLSSDGKFITYNNITDPDNMPIFTVSTQITKDHVLYITLRDSEVISSFKLSDILHCLSKIHIWVDAVSCKINTIVHEDNLKKCDDAVSAAAPDIYEFTIPHDANFVLGACRDIDLSF